VWLKVVTKFDRSSWGSVPLASVRVTMIWKLSLSEFRNIIFNFKKF
jgi:hypothetical protein